MSLGDDDDDDDFGFVRHRRHMARESARPSKVPRLSPEAAQPGTLQCAKPTILDIGELQREWAPLEKHP